MIKYTFDIFVEENKVMVGGVYPVIMEDPLVEKYMKRGYTAFTSLKAKDVSETAPAIIKQQLIDLLKLEVYSKDKP